MKSPLSSHCIVIVGVSGQIGSSLWQQLRATFEHSVIFGMSHKTRKDDLEKIFAAIPKDADIDMIFASGQTDPQLPFTELLEANVNYPIALARETQAKHPKTRFITLGTVHENLDECSRNNPYFRSKKAFSEWYISDQRELLFQNHWAHLQLHTLYSLPIAPHRFLGQMIQSIRTNSNFQMSSGRQIREYQPISLLVQSLKALIQRADWRFDSPLIVSLGEPLTLMEIATKVFESVDRKNLLHLGAKKESSYEPTRENLSDDPQVKKIFTRSPDWLLGDFSKNKDSCTLKLFLEFLRKEI